MTSFDEYLKSRYKLRSIQNDMNVLKLFNRFLDQQMIAVVDVQTSDILDYIRYCKTNGNSHASIQIKVQSLRHYFDYLYQAKTIEDNPIQHLKVKTQKRSILSDLLDEEELDYIYQNYKGNEKTHYRNKVILSLAIYQGLSIKDLSLLKVNDLKLDQGELEASGHSKGKARKLKLNAVQIIELHNYLTVFRPKLLALRKQFNGEESESLILTSRKGLRFIDLRQHLTIDLRKQFSFFKSFQQIRRSVIVKWLKQYNLRQVQYMAGHGSIRTTESFRISQIEDLQSEVELYHPLK